MQFFKRMSLYLFIVLLFMSILNDLVLQSNDTLIKTKEDFTTNNTKVDPINNYVIVLFKVSQGDNVLSIAEKINEKKANSLDIEQLVNDFSILNPGTNPYQLVPNTKYLFPKYTLIE